jgi:transposase
MPIKPVFKMKYRNTKMTYSRMMRIRSLLPFIRKANDKGMSIPEASKWMGWSESSLRNWIRILGVHWRKRRKRNGYRIDKTGWDRKIPAMIADNKSQAQIAATLGVGEWTISRYMKDEGIQPARKTSL